MEEYRVPKEKLRIVYGEILRGCSSVFIESFGKMEVKHLTIFDTELIDEEREKHSERARKKGLPTREEKLQELEKEGSWTKKQEKELAELEDFISRLNETKRKMVLKSEIKRMNEEIKKNEKKVLSLRTEKEDVVGMTCESFADKKANDYYVYLSLFKDKGFKDLFFSVEEFNELSDQELASIVTSFNEMTKKFAQVNLKRVALSSFFLNNFYLCKESPFIFFGKPVVDLTFNQADLFAYGRYFKHILSELKSSPPPEVMEDPDKLLDQYNLEQNKEKVLGSDKDKSGTASTIVGATKEDLEALGVATNSDDSSGETVDLSKAVKESGGSMSMEEIIKLHGV